MPAGPVSRPWRSYFGSASAGIVLVLVIGAELGWIVHGHQAQVQRDAVAAIQKVGGSVYYDWEWSEGTVIPEGKLWAPPGAKQPLHALGDGQVSDAGLEHLKGLTKLRMLCFARNKITEAESAKMREAFPKVTRIVVRIRE